MMWRGSEELCLLYCCFWGVEAGGLEALLTYSCDFYRMSKEQPLCIHVCVCVCECVCVYLPS